MKLSKYFIKERVIIIWAFIVTMLLAMMPLFSVNCIQGHDLSYHLLRIESLKEAILMGTPFLKINVLFFGGRGYASSLFYPDMLLYIPALLRCAGLSINLSFHIFVALCLILSYLAMYICVKLITNNYYTAAIAAIAYTLAQYHLDDVYTRSAVGEYTAFIFIPFLLYGLYEMINADFKRPYTLVLGFCGVILCHTITTMYVLAIFCIAFLFSIKKYLKDLSQLIKLIISAMLTIALTCFYWLPVIEQLMSGTFSGAAEFDLNYEKLLFQDVFINTNPGMGFVIFIPLIFRVFIKNRTKAIKFADVCMIFGLLLTISATGILPWARLQNLVGFIQFPWRSFIVATPLLAMAGAIYVGDNLSEGLGDRVSVLIFIVLISIYGIAAINTYERLDQGYYSYSDDYYSYLPYTADVIGGEWLPAKVTNRSELIEDCDIAHSVYGDIKVDRYKNTLSFTPDGSDYVDVPFIYYKGYEAFLDGNELRVTDEGDNGMCRIYTDGKSIGTVTVKYMQTRLQILSEIISALSLLLAIVLHIKKIICLKK